MPLRDTYLLLIRLFLGYVFASSGLCKLTDGQFGQLIGPPRLIHDLAAYGLSGLGVFLACSQVLLGALTLSGRWALLGLVGLVPLNTGILAFTLAANWVGTPFVNGFLLLLNLLALAAEWPLLRFFLQPGRPPEPTLAHLVTRFPGWLLPMVVIVALSAAAGAALAGQYPLVVALGAVGFITAWVHGARGLGMTWAERVVLALTGTAVLALTFSSIFGPQIIRYAMLAGVIGGLLGCLGLALRWFVARRPAQS